MKNAAEAGELLAMGSPPIACVVLTVQGDALYLSKLAVAATMRGNGLARTLVETAERRARAKGLVALEAQTRVELTENHVIFRALGFEIVGQTAHPGYDRPTSITLRKPL
ncbi:MAG: GNAT family N-acetyltransferase [Pseudomonadota bacterium]